MEAFLPSSDLWWRYFIYGALFHIAAVTPACKTERHATAFRVVGYAVGAVPVLLRLGVLPAVLMLVFLYGFTFAVRYIKSMFK
jgi:hypothetical protein